MVSEAFLSFFVKTVGHFSSHMKRSANGQSRVFQKKSFCNATESKTCRQFAKDFCRTQMFDIFIQEEEGQPSTHEGRFFMFGFMLERSEARNGSRGIVDMLHSRGKCLENV